MKCKIHKKEDMYQTDMWYECAKCRRWFELLIIWIVIIWVILILTK